MRPFVELDDGQVALASGRLSQLGHEARTASKLFTSPAWINDCPADPSVKFFTNLADLFRSRLNNYQVIAKHLIASTTTKPAKSAQKQQRADISKLRVLTKILSVMASISRRPTSNVRKNRNMANAHIIAATSTTCHFTADTSAVVSSKNGDNSRKKKASVFLYHLFYRVWKRIQEATISYSSSRPKVTQLHSMRLIAE